MGGDAIAGAIKSLEQAIRAIERRHALLRPSATTTDRCSFSTVMPAQARIDPAATTAERRDASPAAALAQAGDDFAGATAERRDRVSTGWGEVDEALGGGLSIGGLHEWFGLSSADEARSRGRWDPPVGVLVHLAWQVLSAQPCPLWTVWVGRRCFAYPSVLVRDGTRDRRLLERSLFVGAGEASLRLWAVDLALRSPAVGMVVADGSRWTMAGTRRVQLLSRAHGTPAMVVRPPWERKELSAAQSRWLVSCVPGDPKRVSECINPRWSVELLRCKGVRPATVRHAWTLEWNSDTCSVGLSAEVGGPAGRTQTQPATQPGHASRSPRSA